MRKPIVLVFIFSSFLSACAVDSAKIKTEEKSKELELSAVHPKIKKKYFEDFLGCSKPKVCGEVVSLDCGANVDGDFLYLNNNTAALIMRCGGACESGSHKGSKDCGECPPKEWKCESE